MRRIVLSAVIAAMFSVAPAGAQGLKGLFKDIGKSVKEVFTGEEAPDYSNDLVKDGVLKGKVKEMSETQQWGSVKTVNVYKFDKKGNMTSLDYTTPNGNVNVRAEYTYEDGRLTKRSVRRTEKEYTPGFPNENASMSLIDMPGAKWSFPHIYNGDSEDIEFFYDSDGKLERSAAKYGTTTIEDLFYPDGKLKKRTTTSEYMTEEFTYDAKGNQVSHKQNGKDAPRYDDDYDDYGHDYDESANREVRDASGRLTELHGDGSQTKYTYNANGFLSAVRQSDRWWGDASTTYSGYAYDEAGNWTKRTETRAGDYYKPNGFKMTTTREIAYY